MRRCAYLSMDDLSDFEAYDHLTFEPMAAHGWQVSEVSWRNKDIDWNEFEVVVIRTPWDYQDAAEEFIETIKRIDQSNALLLNSLDTVLWNINKSYLRDFELQGIPIVPTRWMDTYSDAAMHGAYETWGTPEIIIKPQVSANADDTFRLNPLELSKKSELLTRIFDQRAHMLQPFVSAVVEEEEEQGGLTSEIIETPIENLDLSVRVFNSLKRTGITTIGEVIELLEKGDEAVMSIRNFGEKSLTELRLKMAEKGYLDDEETEEEEIVE